MQENIRLLYRKCNQNKYGNALMTMLRWLYSRDPFHIKMEIKNKGSIRFRNKSIEGCNNLMEVGRSTLLNGVEVEIQGNNNRIIIGSNCKMGRNCRLYVYGNNVLLKIGNGTTFSHDDEILVQEDNRKIVIGNDCMFSHHINVRTSDAHPIYAIGGGRINQGKDVHIGNHVWVTPHCIIQKGVTIGDGAIIATRSIATKDVPANCVAAGMPAKVVKEGVTWGRRIE